MVLPERVWDHSVEHQWCEGVVGSEKVHVYAIGITSSHYNSVLVRLTWAPKEFTSRR